MQIFSADGRTEVVQEVLADLKRNAITTLPVELPTDDNLIGHHRPQYSAPTIHWAIACKDSCRRGG